MQDRADAIRASARNPPAPERKDATFVKRDGRGEPENNQAVGVYVSYISMKAAPGRPCTLNNGTDFPESEKMSCPMRRLKEVSLKCNRLVRRKQDTIAYPDSKRCTFRNRFEEKPPFCYNLKKNEVGFS